MQNINQLKEKLLSGKIAVGTWCEIPSPETVNILARAGLDFVIIDMEHGPMDFITTSRMVMAAQVEDCSPIIRVPRNDQSDILRSLELAPAGIMVPHIESEKDRACAVGYLKFPPVGNRSLNPYTRAGGYHSSLELVKEQDRKIILSLVVESMEGINNIERIIDDKNVDIVYIGTYDLSVALGSPGDTQSKIMFTTLKKLIKIIKDKKKIAGTMFHTKNEFNLYRKMGMQFLCYRVDTSVIFDEFQSVANLAK